MPQSLLSCPWESRGAILVSTGEGEAHARRPDPSRRKLSLLWARGAQGLRVGVTYLAQASHCFRPEPEWPSHFHDPKLSPGSKSFPSMSVRKDSALI